MSSEKMDGFQIAFCIVGLEAVAQDHSGAHHAVDLDFVG